MEATRGVNTHRGALFCVGIALFTACRLAAKGETITPDALSEAIAAEVRSYSQPVNTHGATAIRKYGRGGALENAKTGYGQLFTSWLPFLRNLPSGEERSRHLTLLHIMSELDDSNILYRCGQTAADEVKDLAAALKSEDMPPQLLVERLAELNRQFVERNISPGGAADMLSLTLFADRLTTS